jgi:hypothetical protein
MTLLAHLSARIDQLLDKSQRTAWTVVGAGVVAGLIRVILELASRVHWALGVLLALCFAGGAAWLIGRVRHAAKTEDSSYIIAVLAVGLLTLAVVGAWFSFTLHTSGVAHYSTPEAVSAGRFVDFYLYTFIDLLPGVHAWETLNVTSPIKPLEPLAGLPVLAFKLLVVWLFFDVWRSWRKKGAGGSDTAEGSSTGNAA